MTNSRILTDLAVMLASPPRIDSVQIVQNVSGISVYIIGDSLPTKGDVISILS